jgi:hypothetical protein
MLIENINNMTETKDEPNQILVANSLKELINAMFLKEE